MTADSRPGGAVVGWAVPRPPGPPTPAATSREYREASLSGYAVRRGEQDDPLRYMTGAVYSVEGDLVAASQRSGGHRGDFVRAMDPPRRAGGSRAPRRRGRWLYGGHWMGQFGHFVTETLTTLWPEDRDLDGLLFHRFLSPHVVEDWQLALLRASGWDLPVAVTSSPLVVESLVVPTRPLTLNLHAGPEAVRVWDRVRSGVTAPAGASPVFFSRSRLARDARQVPGDESLDEVMRQLGFEVLHPEAMTVQDQLSVAAGTSLIAGVSGSALHLSAFAPASTRVLELGDERRTRELLFTQHVVDAAVGRESAVVPLHLTQTGSRDLSWTADAVSALLASNSAHGGGGAAQGAVHQAPPAPAGRDGDGGGTDAD